jgi:hydroxymethylbilane synthase
VLAAAGLHRLGFDNRITEHLSEELMLPAVGQGALAIETRSDDEGVNLILQALDHKPTRQACRAERAFLKGLGGGCLVPIAAHARVQNGSLSLSGLVASTDGSQLVRSHQSGLIEDAESIGERLAKELISRGADKILRPV